jgi:hypothetical protein
LRARHGPGITLLLVLIITIGLPIAVQAGGRAEKEARARLAEVERLIEARRYNDAILRLTEIVKENPDLFDAAEQLMNRIREVRSQYNAKFEEMVRTLFEERDIAKGLQLIEELQQLDPYPSPAMARALELAKLGRELVVNLKQFTEIMDAAAVLLREGRYAEANAKYLEAFKLGRKSFDAADYGNIVKNSVYASLDSVLQAVGELPARLGALERARAAVGEALRAADPGRVQPPLREALGELSRIAELKDTVHRAGENFRAQELQVRTKAGERNGAERSYDQFLFFAGQVVSGRADRAQEGITVVMGLAWGAYFGPLKRGLLEAAENRWATGVQNYRTARYPQAREELDRAASLYASARDMLALWAAPLPLTSLLRMDPPAVEALRGELPDFLLAQERIQAAGDYGTLIELARALAAPELAESIPKGQIPQARRRITELQSQADGLAEYWGGQGQRFRSLERAYSLSLQPQTAQAEELAAIAASLQQRLAALGARFADVALADTLQRATAALDGFSRRRDEAARLQDGISVALPPIKDDKGNIISTPTRVEKFPSLALAVYRQLALEIAATLEEVAGQEQAAAGFPTSVKQQPNISDQLSRLEKAHKDLSGMQQEIALRAEAANVDSLKAAQYKLEGRQRIQDAVNNINTGARNYDAQRFDKGREDLDKARKNLNDAQRALDDSLSLQEDQDTRRDRDVTLRDLAQRIVEVENTRVVRDVRQKIEAGRRLYLQQKYSEAQGQLIDARNLWEKTQPTENPEITQWLEKIRQAILATSGREIPQTDPLYKPMTQLYNQAYRDYLAGKKLTQEGRVGEAVDAFKEAEGRIGQILPFFKYYTDARELSYRIEQLRDPEKFKIRVDADFRAARSGSGQSEQERLNTLDVLAIVIPNYPGLAAARKELRISLGIEEAPPDPRKIADSDRLYREAKTIYDQRQRDLYPAALEKLNQAILLNPNNAQATSLKDTVTIASGGQRQPYLTSVDEQRFKEAQGQYNLGNFLIALNIVNELLKNKRNQGYGPLLQLKSACEARI